MTQQGDTYLDFELKLERADFMLDVSGQFSDGITAVFGPSGAGKSTLLACLAGLINPDAGHVRLNDEMLFSSDDGISCPPQKRRTVMVFQDGMLFPHLTAGQNIAYGYQLTPREQRAIHPPDLCEFLRIDKLMDRYPSELSGGEKQRVALARGVAASPRLLLLDEPVASLDVRLRNEVVTYLKQVHEKYRIPMIYVSHSLSDVMALAPTAAVLEQGRVKSYGPVVDLVADVVSTTRLGADAIDNLYVGDVTASGAIHIGDVEIVAQSGGYGAGETVTVSISASDIILARDRPERISARNILRGVVRDVSRGDYAAFAFVDAGVEFVVELTPEAVEMLNIAAGTEVYVVFKTSSIMLTAS